MSRHTKGVESRELWEGGLPKGFSAECPMCGTVNEAYYKNNLLVWNPNNEVGVWCKHSTGCYQGGKTPLFLFE